MCESDGAQCMDTSESVEGVGSAEAALTTGCKLPVLMSDDKPAVMAEIVQIRTTKDGVSEYYVHYLDFNKRLDQWVTEKRLDLTQGTLFTTVISLHL